MSDGEGDYEIFNPSYMERAENDESDNSGSMSYDDGQVGQRRRRFQRHTNQQIEELETFFRECTPRPNENQRSELGQRLNMDAQQVKSWFQNRRTQERVDRNRRENVALRLQHDRLLREHEELKEAMVLSIEEQQLQVENANLKKEIDQLQSFLSGPVQLPVDSSAAQPSSSSMISNEPLQLDSDGGNSIQVFGIGIPAEVKNAIVELAQRMSLNYYLGLSNSSLGKWEGIEVENQRPDIRFMIRKNLNEPGELTGIVLSAATCVRFPVNQQKMFDFLSNQNFRNQWDALTSNTSVEEKVRIQIASRHGNYISLFQIAENDMLVLQEIWNNASGASVVYAIVDPYSLKEVTRDGADLDFVQMLPSGFSISPDGETDSSNRESDKTGGGCLLTLAFQVLVSTKQTSELTQKVKIAEKLLDWTIDKIKSGLHRE